LHETTADGFVYRVDLRLRPWGDAGPLVLSHNAFEHYYQLHGREWEQYAMVKARVITGSDSDKKYLKSIIKPFVYRRYHDYRVFDGLAQLKLKIDRQAKHSETRNNVKIGRGGIREIEFFVQAFQILKGGRNHQLQTQSLFKAIETLTQQHITDTETLVNMRESYCFLRLLENRLQMLNDQQTHEVPQKQNTRDRLCLLLGYADWQGLEKELKHHQHRVNEIFSSLFDQQQESQQQDIVQNFDELSEEQHLQAIESLGFTQTQQIHQRLVQFYQSRSLLFMSEKAKKRFHAFFPELLKQISQHQQQFELLEKLLALLSSIAGRSVYFELLYLNIPLLVKLVHLFDSSNWIATEVTRYPMLLESLLFPGQFEDRLNKQKLQQELQIQLQNVADDEELELDVLRQFKRAQTIVIA
ncbi:MAG: bifunctional glutamine synthetase adenylyltransferase/deadenyltransferase, partial [Gammaproteobacteria bacterium]|nr:bifunctional glutamine synthetase adenylyltransferase/deadenyltransferase [Gammaproteobacteria bacterium]